MHIIYVKPIFKINIFQTILRQMKFQKLRKTKYYVFTKKTKNAWKFREFKSFY